MLTMEEAKKLALEEIMRNVEPGIDPVIMDEHTLAKPYGWVFAFNTREYVETRDPLQGLAGNGPVIVQHNGKVHLLGSGTTFTDAVADLEKKRGWRS